MKQFILTLFTIALLTSASAHAVDEGHDFDYSEINTFVSKDQFTLGYRFYVNHPKDYTQLILRWNFKDTPHRVEYRRIDNLGKTENWYRYQHKGIKSNGFFITPRIEFRDRSFANKTNIVRLRPQLGYEKKFFLIMEPQFTTWSEDGQNVGFSHAQYFVGYSFKVSDNLKVVPQVQFESNEDWKLTKQFLTVDFKYSF